MNVAQAKHAAWSWIRENSARWPDLLAAHLTGGITAMTDAEPFPPGKDVDLLLIFAAAGPTLRGLGPWDGILEVWHRGIAIEAGLKSDADYCSPETVLANPEIAFHLTADTILHDPTGMLHALQPAIRLNHARPRWVRARIEHERQGLARAFGLLPMARAAWGAAGEVNILGYTTTFATAVLWVASLDPPNMGSRSVFHLRESLTRRHRLDLYEAILEALGIAGMRPETVARFLREAIEGFDLAIALQEAPNAPDPTPGPFRHKRHRHLRPYLVDPCREMLAAGNHREAMAWVLPYHLATGGIVQAEGSAAMGALFASREASLLHALGLVSPAARDDAAERLREIYEGVFALAEQIAAAHRAAVDETRLIGAC